MRFSLCRRDRTRMIAVEQSPSLKQKEKSLLSQGVYPYVRGKFLELYETVRQSPEDED
jgi:hypothetical protein